MLAESVKITDFFDRAAESWAALGRVTTAARDTADAARMAEDCARAVPESGRAGTPAHGSLQNVVAAVMAAQDAEDRAEFAQARVSESHTAQKQAAAARQQAGSNADIAVEAAKSLKDRMAKSSATLFKAVDGAENVRRLADQAMAVEGDRKIASSLAADAGRVAEEVVKAMEELFSAKERAHKTFFKLV
jgi:hypothetical protein